MTTTVTMSTRIDKLANNDWRRYGFGNVLVDTKNNLAASSDGAAVAIVPIERSGDPLETSVLVPYTAMNKGKAESRTLSLNDVTASRIEGSSVTAIEYGEGRYPNVSSLSASGVPTVRIALDHRLLSRLGDALCEIGGDSVLVMDIVPEQDGTVLQPIAVAPASGIASAGLIMPAVVGNDVDPHGRWEELRNCIDCSTE